MLSYDELTICPGCTQSLLKAARIGSSSGKWMGGSCYFQESHKAMKMHLFCCHAILHPSNPVSPMTMQNSSDFFNVSAHLKEFMESPMCPTKRETLWRGTGARRASEVNHPVIITLAVFSFTVSRMQQFGHLK